MSTIDKRMTKARSALVISQPFFGTLALHLQIVDAVEAGHPEYDTMATDGKRLYYHPDFLDKLNEHEIRGVVAHEVLHCAYRHMTRRQKRDGRLWNIAGDYAINRDLLSAGFILPKEGIFDTANRFVGMNAERIYDILLKEEEAKPKQQGAPGAGQPGSGTPEPGGFSDPGKCGGVIDAAPEGSNAENAQMDREWEMNVRQALNVAAAGKAPAALTRIAKQIAHQTVDWREMLRRFIDETVRRDYSWVKPNKRMLHSGFILPGMIPDGVSKIGVIIDTSGSIDNTILSRFMAEIQAAMDIGNVEKLVSISCDSRVYNPQEFDQGDEIKVEPKGGGGTMFSPALKWFEENHPDCAALIYFTDLCCNDWGEEPQCPMLWAVYGDYRQPIPFGEMIELSGT